MVGWICQSSESPSKAAKHHQLPLPPAGGPSKRARGGGGFPLPETEDGESTEDIDAKSTTSVRTSQSEFEMSEASRKRQISPNGYDNITPPFPTGNLDGASNTVIRSDIALRSDEFANTILQL